MIVQRWCWKGGQVVTTSNGDSAKPCLLISPFFPGLGLKKTCNKKHMPNHRFAFLCPSRMEWLFLKNSKILCSWFLYFPARSLTAFQSAKLEGTGDEWSIYSVFTAVGFSTSSWWKLTLVFCVKRINSASCIQWFMVFCEGAEDFCHMFKVTSCPCTEIEVGKKRKKKKKVSTKN